MPPGSGDDAYLKAFDSEVLPWLDHRLPDVVVVSAGFDAHRDDPLAHQRLSAAAYRAFTERLAARPVLAVLEGGYGLAGLEASVRAVLEALIAA
jgi:acetoin utilization deacetylase AcuC-like enzyme